MIIVIANLYFAPYLESLQEKLVRGAPNLTTWTTIFAHLQKTGKGWPKNSFRRVSQRDGTQQSFYDDDDDEKWWMITKQNINSTHCSKDSESATPSPSTIIPVWAMPLFASYKKREIFKLSRQNSKHCHLLVNPTHISTDATFLQRFTIFMKIQHIYED